VRFPIPLVIEGQFFLTNIFLQTRNPHMQANDQVLDQMGGEPLAGSGFEAEIPEADFEESIQENGD
jgi:hypothetical protein